MQLCPPKVNLFTTASSSCSLCTRISLSLLLFRSLSSLPCLSSTSSLSTLSLCPATDHTLPLFSLSVLTFLYLLLVPPHLSFYFPLPVPLNSLSLFPFSFYSSLSLPLIFLSLPFYPLSVPLCRYLGICLFLFLNLFFLVFLCMFLSICSLISLSPFVSKPRSFPNLCHSLSLLCYPQSRSIYSVRRLLLKALFLCFLSSVPRLSIFLCISTPSQLLYSYLCSVSLLSLFTPRLFLSSLHFPHDVSYVSLCPFSRIISLLLS